MYFGMPQITELLEQFTGYLVLALALLVAFLGLLGLVNAVVVIVRTVVSSKARTEEPDGKDPKAHLLPKGIISMYSYLQLLADVLLVLVAVELIDTMVKFLNQADPTEYLTGVLGAALVALARRVIVFFNPEAQDVSPGEMYGYAALVAALAAAYAMIALWGQVPA